MRIMVDVDNTLYDAHSLFSQVAKDYFGVTLPESSYNWHQYDDSADIGTLREIFRLSHSAEFVKTTTPYEGAAEVLNMCNDKNHEVFFVSDRHPRTAGALTDWLKHHNFPAQVDEMVCNVIVSKDKREWMERTRPHVVIDDRVRTMFFSRQWEAHVYSLEHPWNMNLRDEVEGITICKDWNEIGSELNKII